MERPEIPVHRYLPTCCPFLPIESYQQGVLSATILYEILLGKATVYAVLVSALVLMAMVRGTAGWQDGWKVMLKTQKLGARSMETLPGPEVGREKEGVVPPASAVTCTHGLAVGEPGRKEQLGSPENQRTLWEPCSSSQWAGLLPLNPHHLG